MSALVEVPVEAAAVSNVYSGVIQGVTGKGLTACCICCSNLVRSSSNARKSVRSINGRCCRRGYRCLRDVATSFVEVALSATAVAYLHPSITSSTTAPIYTSDTFSGIATTTNQIGTTDATSSQALPVTPWITPEYTLLTAAASTGTSTSADINCTSAYTADLYDTPSGHLDAGILACNLKYRHRC